MTTTPGEPLQRVLEKARNYRRTSTGYMAICPSHDDRTPSLSISEGDDGRVLLKCFAGCATEDILSAWGLAWQDLFPDTPQARVRGSTPAPQVMPPIPPRRPQSPPSRVTEMPPTYIYTDADGTPLFGVHRIQRGKSKTFRQSRPDPAHAGRWLWGLGAVRRVLYNLPRLMDARSNQWVFVVEGEKDADALTQLGLLATTNAGGAGKWRDEYSEILQGARVCILPDNDEPGRAHSEQVERSLYGKALEVKVLMLPGLPPKGDVSDWLAAGGTADALLTLVNTTHPAT